MCPVNSVGMICRPARPAVVRHGDQALEHLGIDAIGSGWNASQSRKHAHRVEAGVGDPLEVLGRLRRVERRDHHRIAVRAGQ